MQFRQHYGKYQTNLALCSDLRLENHIFQKYMKTPHCTFLKNILSAYKIFLYYVNFPDTL